MNSESRQCLGSDVSQIRRVQYLHRLGFGRFDSRSLPRKRHHAYTPQRADPGTQPAYSFHR